MWTSGYHVRPGAPAVRAWGKQEGGGRKTRLSSPNLLPLLKQTQRGPTHTQTDTLTRERGTRGGAAAGHRVGGAAERAVYPCPRTRRRCLHRRGAAHRTRSTAAPARRSRGEHKAGKKKEAELNNDEAQPRQHAQRMRKARWRGRRECGNCVRACVCVAERLDGRGEGQRTARRGRGGGGGGIPACQTQTAHERWSGESAASQQPQTLRAVHCDDTVGDRGVSGRWSACCSCAFATAGEASGRKPQTQCAGAPPPTRPVPSHSPP